MVLVHAGCSAPPTGSGRLPDQACASVSDLARAFRAALETFGPTASGRAVAPLHRFPSGCCSIASCLLARYLYEHDYHDTRCVYGPLRWDKARAHEWVRTGAVIVDITADQFGWISPRPDAVIVTTCSKFHSRWGRRKQLAYAPNWSAWGWTQAVLRDYEAAYAELLSLIAAT